MYGLHWSGTKFSGNVNFETIESFYGYADGESTYSIVCPKGSNNPYEITSTNTLNEISQFSSTWLKNKKYELKCYYHREEPFLVFYLMNEENYILRLKGRTLTEAYKFRFSNNFKAIYDFKLMNRDNRGGNSKWYNPYPFMALVNLDGYLQLVATKFDFYASNQQSIYSNNKKLIPIKNLYILKYFLIY